jgi:hypothetical protein
VTDGYHLESNSTLLALLLYVGRYEKLGIRLVLKGN